MENLVKQLLGKDTNYVFTKSMAKDEWRNARRSSIGGSDAGAIMGLNKWASPLTVYLDKKGLHSFEGNMFTERGSWLEDPIRQRCREEFGVLIEEVPYMFYSGEQKFMSANIDGLIYVQEPKTISGIEVSGLGGHEIKTSQRGDGFGENEIPDSYFAQVQHYMSVLNLDWFVLSAYIIDKNELRHYAINRDEAFITRLVKAEKTFWEDFIEENIMPAPSGVDAEDEAIAKMFEGAENTIILDGEAESMSAEYLLINAQIKELEEKKSKLSSSLKLKIIEQQTNSEEKKAKAVAGKYNLSFSKSIRRTVDSEKLKKDGLYEQYLKESEVAMLRITEPKAK
ncbi:endonuclease [Treponema phagedenis]|uniref:Endonuclease n=3 Tax=Treponema phagedenis TaxID=162 RepID=A0A0B7GZF9_TREPH|nr:YqaJ viral recombinase family protein [Treponema phagedenis]EFW38505.1 YqaJ viral recombinase family protein [Treponema phagedenis F0421]NVP23093.1 YqaJ viral recombinase family protein [Treponema phagedenis]NVP23538.1 YqaJ viral recombinase family protein [Treponema phagedenis]NVP23770.1 YqaJ viral recombinase family protein [Treponema phagedenis]QEJ94625.1 endonuclease [Treponema phagedenis]